SHGINVAMANDYIPTPAVSYAVKQRAATGGIVITSSHNPYNWNGVKYKAYYGGSAKPSIIQSIEKELYAGTQPPRKQANVTLVDLKTPYIEAITKFAELDKIAKTGFKYGIDCMHGTGRGILAGIFASRGIKHVEIRNNVDPMFGGVNPEPIMP